MPPSSTLSLPAARRRGPAGSHGVLFAVYAPFGGDPVLSRWPRSSQAPIHQQALVQALKETAAQGVNVAALIDLHDDDSWLVEIPAGRPERMTVHSVWKQDMARPQALSGFLRRAHARFPCGALVLALEGHGAGFVPEIDPLRLTPESITGWQAGGQAGEVRWVQSADGTGYEPEAGSPALPMFSPVLPMFSPVLPAAGMPMSTWALAAALRAARARGVPRPAVLHFNNCFNMSLELLHTVAPHATVATGYGNYNFFTAGAAYPRVFQRLRMAGGASAEELGRWFALENAALLRAKGNHPTLGASLRLSRVRSVTAALDRLARAMTAAMQAAAGARGRIRQAIVAAQQFDSDADQHLETPDQVTDLGSLAVQLQAVFGTGDPIGAAAAGVESALKGVWQYGDFERPWTDESQVWDFRARYLGVGIFLPDPALQGRWDWRSPYYLAGIADPTLPPAHRAQIPFLSDLGGRRPDWVAFLVEYHRGTAFKGFLPPRAPVFPVFNARFKPEFPPPTDNDPAPAPPKPPRRRGGR
ncbi:clostripain-related cysteine peptidase [Rubrivivax albus]|uniref:Uncharacterized protein n=1 Tax=Rubrivivax albus TaxID=2499835 RepID=A0A437JW75_9BURK|nr:clostripain-related cysteine peptidase [Rubrivivax albus]RVT51623.1 hypothetical protein ENE75_12465 [Rubrivivax albus]